MNQRGKNQIAGVLILIIFVVTVYLAYPHVMTILDALSPSSSPQSQSSREVPPSAPASKELVIVDDSGIKATYTGCELINYIPGQPEAYALYLHITVENKTGEEITVYLQDTSINEVMSMALSAVPQKILDEKKAACTFFFTQLDGTGITSAKDIENLENIEFKLCAWDDGMKTIFSSGTIVIE